MAAENTTSTMVGYFKEIYGEDVLTLAPASRKLSKKIPFGSAEALGGKYHQPVDLQMEHGLTAAAANAGVVDLEQPTAGQMGDAQLEGSQIFARAQVDYETIFRATEKGKAAFGDSVKHIVKRLTLAASKALEIQILHGRRGLGYIASKTGSSTTRVYTINDAAWSAGIWCGMKGANLDVWKADYSAKINTNAAVVVTSVDLDNKTVSVSGNATDLTNIDTEIGSPTGGSLNAHLFRRTFSPTTEFAGLDSIGRNTGTMMNIDGSTNELWKGVVHSVGSGALTMAQVLKGIAKAASRGLEGDVICTVSPTTYESNNTDQAALRRFGMKESKAESGFGGIVYEGQTGLIEIVPHIYEKDGMAHAFPPNEAKRIGATDLTFITRGSNGKSDQLIRELTDKGGSEMRCYSNQALFVDYPAHVVVFDSIVNT
jgi:hypothetical protein